MMKRFLNDFKGAVTVMVTLLLIPAILITGTGVDIARIHTARSIVQDANQLAGNAALTEYDALLQDLYGLYGLMKSDHEFATMVDEYLKLTILGESWVDKDVGTFQLFYGANISSTGVSPAQGKTLKNPDVLRRQIEEYAKLRAPIIVVEKILDKLDTFEKVQEDAKVIQKKLQVDDKVEDVDKAYRKVYECIQDIWPCDGAERSMMDQINKSLDNIYGEFKEMYQIRNDYTVAYNAWQAALLEEDGEADALYYENLCKQYETEYVGQWNNIQAYINGGKIKSYSNGEVVSEYSVSAGLESYINTCVRDLENCIDSGSNKSCGNRHLKELVELCRDADKKKEELKKRVEELESQLNSGKCTAELKNGMMESDETGKSMIEQYKALCEVDLEPMGQAMYEEDSLQIRETIEIMKNAGLGQIPNPYTWKTIKGLSLADFPINSGVDPSYGNSTDTLSRIVSIVRAKHEPARNGFKQFDDALFSSTGNGKFYHDTLIPLCRDEGNSEHKKNAKKNVTKIFEEAQKLFTEKLNLTPEGAEYLTDASDNSDSSTGTDFGTEGDWSKENEGKDKLEKSLDGDFLSKLTDAAGELGNHAILMVYATEMFSDYSTPRSSDDDFPEKNMAGIPLSTEVNYYFNSELEYLYNGNLADAHANLRSVAGMILLVRFIFNYVASFTVSSVKTTVASIKAALSATGPFAILISELARMGLAIGESALDVERLRQGEQVALFKGNDEWRFSVSGLAKTITEKAVDVAFDTNSSESAGDEHGLTYTDYMRLFLLLTNGDDLAHRISNLIELNVTNYRDGINADEEKMASANRFNMGDAVTDFTITTTVDLRMLFLSMPFAQKGIDGVIPPKTLPISVSDYRGY